MMSLSQKQKRGVMLAIFALCPLTTTGCHKADAPTAAAPPPASPTDGLSRDQAMQQMQQQMKTGMHSPPANGGGGANGGSGTP